jgi:hypothetical protein
MRRRLLPTTALAALASACGLQDGNSQRAAAAPVAGGHPVALADLCAIARHPERFDGQRLRVRAIVIPDVEYISLVSPACIRRGWAGTVGIDPRGVWHLSGTEAAAFEARRRSTASRPLAAEGEFEAIVHASPRPAPVNARDFGPMPPYVAMLEVVNVDHVRLVGRSAGTAFRA